MTGYALAPPTTPSLYDQAGVAKTLRSVTADVRDLDRLTAELAASRPDVVIHMAAQSVVKRGYADPVETYASNVMGTVHLFEAVRRIGQDNGKCVVVNVTSDKCYAHRGGASDAGYREDEPMGGDDPYSNSKGCAELVTAAFRQSYDLPVASARAGNAVGGGDWTADQLIPDLIRAFVAGRPCPIRSPRAIRPWQFVLEPLRGYLMLAERLHQDGAAFASAWNFGPGAGDARPVSWIADRLRDAWGGAAAWAVDSGAHPAEAAVLKLDATKAATHLDWRPALTLERALEWIVAWYRGWHRGDDVGRLTRAQIAAYEELVNA